ncbi:MAG: hypothetical protein SFZ02_03885 [bacterium]|nr:hypothetical protein [bacterium]
MTNLSELYHIQNLIDTFALGHYARVLEAQDLKTGKSVAFKVMRPEHLSDDGEIKWEYRAFPHEADLLIKLAESPHVVNLLDCGYVQSPHETPTDGEVVSFGIDGATFAKHMHDYAEKGWRPYLVMPNLPRHHNLFYQMKPNQPNTRWRLPSEEGLALAVQFAHFLQTAHRQYIAYLDHKLEHVYWDGSKLTIIDLNSSRFIENRANAGGFFRMDVHNLCVGILYSTFTGLSPYKTTLKPQPSNMVDVEKRYQDVTTLDFGVEPTLSVELQAVLQGGASMQTSTVDEFLAGLQQVSALHGWDFPNSPTTAINREARDKLRQGLRRLRQGQDNLREARDLFRDAAILDGITPDMEDELRRLVKSANDMLNHRVIP